MSDIAKNIKQLRLAREMSQAQLAEKLNVTRQTISSWERGASYPDIPMLEKLAEVFGVEMGDLIYPQGEKKPLLSKNEPLSMGFVPISVFIYVVLLLLLQGGLWWAMVLLVAFVALCTCIITAWISEALSGPAHSKFDEDLKKHTQKQE